MTLYRKYRPQVPEDIDQEDVRRMISRIISSKNFAHAYLLVGPRGTGKTSAARILAKAVNCVSEKSAETTRPIIPCSSCDACLSIREGSFLDLFEMDAASNRGIDEIRSIREHVHLPPAVGKKKVYIIDEAHMLTKEAFNALLKTLEEPPEHALFLLCTTEPEEILKTVSSRCQILTFPSASPEDIRHALLRVIKGEKLEVQDDVIKEIALRSEGSFRDAIKLLELFLQTGKPTVEGLREVLRSVTMHDRLAFLRSILQGQKADALARLDAWFLAGIDISLLTKDLVNDLRACFLHLHGMKQEEGIETFAHDIPLKVILKLMRVVAAALLEMKETPIPVLPLELMIGEWDEMVLPFSEEHAPLELNVISNEWKQVIEKIKPKNHALASVIRSARPVALDKETLTLEVGYAYHKDRLDSPEMRTLVEETIREVMGNHIRLRTSLGRPRPMQSDDLLHLATEIFGGHIVGEKGGGD